MNWTNELLDLYEKNQDIAGEVKYKTVKGKKGQELIPLILLPVFHTTVTAQITVTIAEDGGFLGAKTVSKEDNLTLIPVTDKSLSRTAGIEPHPFCDNLKYLAGDYMAYYRQGKKLKDYSDNYSLYIESLRKWQESPYTHKKVNAIYKYLCKGTLIKDLVGQDIILLDDEGKMLEAEKIQNVAQSDAFVRFCVEGIVNTKADILGDASGRYHAECWLDRTLQEAYIQYYSSILSEKDLCYLTGKRVSISYLQPKKIRHEGDGAKLISSNDESNYTFRGRFSNKAEAFAIGYEASQKVHNALKWIIRKRGYRWEDLCVVIWESGMYPVPSWNVDTDALVDEYEEFASQGDWDEDEVLESETGEAQASSFQRAMRGYGRTIGDMSRIVLLAFDSATTGRLAMTEYKSFESSRFLDNLTYWHEGCNWLQVKYKEGHKYEYMGMAGVSDIAEAIYGTEQNGKLVLNNKKMYAQVCKRLLPCISDRRKIPLDMVRQAVQKASSPVSYEKRYNWEAVLGIACAMVKKERKEQKKEEWSMALDKECKNRDYLYGRLLAVADKIERRTFDRDEDAGRETNADRLMNAFSQHPYQTWTIIERRIHPYLRKLDIKERNYYKKMMDDIYELFDADSFTNNDRLKGIYLLGYHSQMNEMRYQKAEEKKED
ncbi:type I-C CRISPR-associated protein Cas8c/Csd1 [Dorea sp. D27]|uniref:type I-C CRISPR-associated protein Cas8c/Csd1 n=1 Tax=Dorea sp. D27 TaxID=658665 RepID=UPI000673BD1D|nr:type I-C CRISPR-associated protein Cas8c/Csd1 [Dorea sp. D27]KMZ53092.1 CRISPR-associated protein, Csd1 family [Dorea sp. D27]